MLTDLAYSIFQESTDTGILKKNMSRFFTDGNKVAFIAFKK